MLLRASPEPPALEYGAGVQAEHAVHDPQRAFVVLLAAGVGHREQHVVGNLGVVLSQHLFAPGDGHLQEVVGVGEFAHGRAHRGQTLQHVVAKRVFARQLLRQVPGLQQGLAGALVVAMHVEACAAVSSSGMVGAGLSSCAGRRRPGQQAAANRTGCAAQILSI
jgi:hypothetical protein